MAQGDPDPHLALQGQDVTFVVVAAADEVAAAVEYLDDGEHPGAPHADTMDVLYLRRYLDAVFHMRCAPCFSLFTVERFHYTPYPGLLTTNLAPCPSNPGEQGENIPKRSLEED